MIATRCASKCISIPKYITITSADEDLQDQQELPLRDQVGLARLVDQVRDLEHRRVHRQRLELPVDHEAEHQPGDADDQPVA